MMRIPGRPSMDILVRSWQDLGKIGTFLIDRTIEKTFLIDRTHYIETGRTI